MSPQHPRGGGCDILDPTRSAAPSTRLEGVQGAHPLWEGAPNPGGKHTRGGLDFCTASSLRYSSAACNPCPAHHSLLALGTAMGSQAARSVRVAEKATCS